MTTRRRKPKPRRGTPAAAPAKSSQSLDFTYLHLTLTHKEHRVEHSINFTGKARPSENLPVIEDVLEEMEHFIARLDALKPPPVVVHPWDGKPPEMTGATCPEDMV